MKRLRYIKNRSGFTLMELLVTMLVLMILGSTIGGLVRTGLSSYGNIKSDAEYETEARTALSLITVQLRQHDETGSITYYAAQKRLKLRTDPLYDAGNVIWFADGTVYLAQVLDVDEIVSTADATPVAAVLDMDITQQLQDDNTYVYTVTIDYGADEASKKTLSQTVTQRSQAASS